MKISTYMTDFYLNIFHQQGEAAVIAFCNCDIPSQVFLQQYAKMPPIEDLPEHEKKELKQYVIEAFPGKSKEFMVNAAKIIHTVGNLI